MSTLVKHKVWVLTHPGLGDYRHIVAGSLPDVVHQVFSSDLASVHVLDALANLEVDSLRSESYEYGAVNLADIIIDALELPTEREVLERLEVDSLCEEGLIWFLLEAWGFEFETYRVEFGSY